MPSKAAKVTITERQHDILVTLRAAVILLTFDGLRNEDITEELGLGGRQGTRPK